MSSARVGAGRKMGALKKTPDYRFHEDNRKGNSLIPGRKMV